MDQAVAGPPWSAAKSKAAQTALGGADQALKQKSRAALDTIQVWYRHAGTEAT